MVSSHVIDVTNLPDDFPTHMHDPAFWEALGRAVATFGFLEEVLGKAIYALTGAKEYTDAATLEQAYLEWQAKLERALYDPLGGLIDKYSKAAKDHSSPTLKGYELLINDLRKAATLRNVLCHGSWRTTPDSNGASIPFYVNRKLEIFEDRVDVAYLEQVRTHVAELACSVINSVTIHGIQFPGSEGPGLSLR